MIAVLFAVLSGAAITTQTSVNAVLRRALGSPFASSLVSFSVGLTTITTITLIAHRSLSVPTEAWNGPWWIWTGGALGVIFLTLNILMITRLGAIQTAIFPVVGQVLMGLIIDAFGLFGAQHTSMTLPRILGMILVVAGAIGVTLANLGPGSIQRAIPHHRAAVSPPQQPRAIADDDLDDDVAYSPAPTRLPRREAELMAWRFIGLLGGMAGAAQSAVNGHLGVLMNSPLKASVTSFVVGASILIVLNLVLRTWRSRPRAAAGQGPLWMWFGGMLGAGYVTANAALVPILGTGMTIVAGLMGTTLASVLIDHFGLIGNHRRKLTWLHFVGLAVLIAGVALVRFNG